LVTANQKEKEMREKNKRILKGIGVGTLACVGLFGLTGCAKVEISQDKFNDLVEIAEKADDFMQNQNTNLEKLVEEANKMTKEEIWNLAKTADFNMMTNANGVRDNVLATMESLEGDTIETMECMYYNTDEMKVFAECYDGAELWYQTNESNVILADIDENDDNYECEPSVDDRGEHADFDDCIGVYRGAFGVNLFDLTYEKFNHYEILDNGNFALTYLDYDYNYQDETKETNYEKFLIIYTCEYSLDGKLISLKLENKLIDTEGEITSPETFRCGKITFEYGAVDTELVESWVALAEAQRNAQ
jgi:hypothetical protein